MGLDLTISEQTDFRTDNKGRWNYTVVQLFNLRNCWRILEKLGDRRDGCFYNCSTLAFNEGTFHAILRELMQDLQDETNERSKEQLKYEIEKLEKFLKNEGSVEEEPTEDYDEIYEADEFYGRTFEVHAWW